MDLSAPGEIAWTRDEYEQLAKEWLLRIVERTPLEDVEGLPLGWITAEAPQLIADVLGAVADPDGEQAHSLADEERAERIAAMRAGGDGAPAIPSDLAALQALMIESIGRELGGRRQGDLAAAAVRLAAAFGELQGAVTASLVDAHSGAISADGLTGLPTTEQFDDWLRILLAEERRYGHPFALALVEIDGLEQINRAYGRVAGDRMISALSGVITRQIRACDQAFRLDEGEFAVLAPHTLTAGLVPMAERIAALIEAAQSAEGPRIAVAIGIAECPGDGHSADHLIGRAEEASYDAKAAGRAVIKPSNGDAPR